MTERFVLFDIPGCAGLTLQAAGDMGPSSRAEYHGRTQLVAEARKRCADRRTADPQLLGAAPTDREAELRLITLPQVHSTLVHPVHAGWPFGETARSDSAGEADRPNGEPGIEAELPAGDGLVTDDDRVVLSVTVADCLPIFLFDESGSVRALVHSGWRGTGIAANAVEEMVNRYGAVRERIGALIGPGICGRCYEVGPDVFEHFRTTWGTGCVRVEGSPQWQYYVDLAAANEVLLQEAGVTDIRRSNACTMEDPRFSSYRRDGAGFSRMLAFYATR